MKVFVTKYALTRGILEMDVEDCKTSSGMVRTLKDFPIYFHGEGKDWHRTHDAARAKAEDMRVKKIASLHKQIKKFEKMEF